MDFIGTLSRVLGIVCVVIGLLLLPLYGWFFWNGIKGRDKLSVVISILILAFAVFVFVGAYLIFTQGLLRNIFKFPLG